MDLQLATDVLRWLGVGASIPLLIACIYAISQRITWDQRLRFAALAAVGVSVVGSQLDRLGTPGTWRTPVITVGVLLGLVGTAMFLIRRREDNNPGR